MPRLSPRETAIRDAEIIRLYSVEKLSCNKIAPMFNMTVPSVHKRLVKHGVKTRSNKENSRKYFCDEDFFEVIDTEDKAYWLGFIYADGYVSSNRKYGQKVVGLLLSNEDYDHVRKFNSSIKSSYPIKTYESLNTFGEREYTSSYARVVITSDKMFNDLVDKGVVEHKTNVLKFPSVDILPVDLQRHFIRGYFDGDGCITWTGNEISRVNLKIVGTPEFIKGMLDASGVTARIELRYKDRDNVVTAVLARKHGLIKFLDYMYKKSSIHLGRKYNKYVEVMQGLQSIQDKSNMIIERRNEILSYIREHPNETYAQMARKLGLNSKQAIQWYVSTYLK
ncbi:hypothetical protein QB910_000057 [Dabrowskivirus KKP3916]|uniref:Homing endonuclease LAGLIDADG domain-containing protein n=1 Tax=Alicyclobacillus phage KKP_3916 TaxID=3040651 RepID=A0AAT9V7L6_9CAUD|nr:hypothetical protein QB910_000057 [Alicyclobacillus phage KKP 3916]